MVFTGKGEQETGDAGRKCEYVSTHPSFHSPLGGCGISSCGMAMGSGLVLLKWNMQRGQNMNPGALGEFTGDADISERGL